MIPFDLLWKHYNRIIKPNRAIILTATQPFSSALIMSNVSQYKASWYWRKEKGTNFVQAKRYPMKVIEECILFCKGTPLYNPIMKDVKPYTHVLPKQSNSPAQHMDSKSLDDNGNRIYKTYDKAYPINLLEIPRDNIVRGKSLHPTQKPVALFEYLIRTYTNEEDIVLDNTAGVMTTAVACINTNRQYICIEKDKGYFEKGTRRVNDHLELKKDK